MTVYSSFKVEQPVRVNFSKIGNTASSSSLQDEAELRVN